jgi:penicillin-binding protein 1A
MVPCAWVKSGQGTARFESTRAKDKMANGPGAPRARRTPLQALIYWTLVLGVWGLIFIVGFLAVFATDLPDTSTLYAVKRQPSISYLDRSGALVAVRGSQESPPVDIDQLPAYVPAAFIAIEDRQFYHHFGFNPWGMIRAEYYNLTHRGATLQGGSTITQQLARNLFLTPTQSIRRKAQELILAVWLETKFTKKQILALYLNRVNFGGGAYGIEAASQRYFNKPAAQLTLGEAALLAATMKGPSRYNPAANSDRAAKRATVVLNAMVSMGAITAAQRDEAFAHPVHVSATLASQRAQYFTDWLDAQVRALTGKEPTEDLVVETTLDLPIQAAAEAAVRGGVAAHANQGVQQGALVALDGEGRIRAYVGGAAYADSQFDRATEAQRQAGSSFKPFVYLTAMEAGHTPSEMVVDEPITIGNWQPKNYTGKYLGQITLQTALAQSINTVAARLANEVGTTNVAATAHRLGITSNIQTDPSMALGAVEVSPLEMAEAYDAFANGGFRVHPYGIERIRTASGQVLYDHGVDKPQPQAVIGQPALAEMTQMMRQVVAAGTGTKAKIGGYDLAGKTGTTSDYRDAWFVGFTGGFVTAVWVGRDDNTPMKRVTGGGAPAEIWRNFMVPSLPRLQAQAIPGGSAPIPDQDLIGNLIPGDQTPAPTPEAPVPDEDTQPSTQPPPAEATKPPF